MGTRSLPARPQWYRDMIAELRAKRKKGEIPAHEFAELAADQVADHPDFLRSLAIADVARYDRAASREQQAALDDEAAMAQAQGYIKQSLFPEEVLAKLGLDPKLQLGFDRSVQTADATHDERMKAIAELERKKKAWETSIDREIAAIRALDELAGNSTLREIVADPPALEEGAE